MTGLEGSVLKEFSQPGNERPGSGSCWHRGLGHRRTSWLVISKPEGAISPTPSWNQEEIDEWPGVKLELGGKNPNRGHPLVLVHPASF